MIVRTRPTRLLLCTLWLLGFAALPMAHAQQGDFDASWYDPAQPYVKIAVTADGVYRVTGQDLAALGVPTSTIDPATLRLFERGREIPLHYEGTAGPLGPGDAFAFIGRRNRGGDEQWAYNGDPTLQSSTFFSLYTDTTTYWLTWGGPAGLRYEPVPAGGPAGTLVTALRDTLHREQDNAYYDGDSNDAGHPLYTRGEGYYWERFGHGTQQNTIERDFNNALNQASRSGQDQLHVRVRLSSQTASRHRVTLHLRLKQGGTTGFVPVDTVDWTGYAFETLTATLPQDQIPDDGNLHVRLVSTNAFGSGVPNGFWMDWIEVDYVRLLETASGRLSFSVPQAGAYTFALGGFAGPDVRVYNPRDRRLLTPTSADGALQTADTPSGPATYWAVHSEAYLRPDTLRLDASSDWASPSQAADLVILTTAQLRPSADALAAYRATAAGGGHTVAVVEVQDVFDQFDYGRATPIAIRRFVRAALGWATPARYLLLWGDALYPNRTRPSAPWEVPSFGNAASDGWFAMQTGGAGDWSEALAVGRIPLRDNDAGALFLQKIQDHEAAPSARWKKRGLFLVGGVTEVEQEALQRFTLAWSDQAAAPPTGLDTLHFFKNAATPLDPTFKDSLRLALRQGAAWLSYFGHSAAQTWEIVTDPPQDYDNAGRLPVALSLGCYTGNFAISAPTLAEDLVLGSLNGSIAHWGSSNLGAIGTSARLADEVHRSVFVDTLRALGTAMQTAKARFFATQRDPLAVKHLLQYGLIGDPATHMALPERPDFAVTPAQIDVRPLAPVPADSQLTVTVRAENLGLVPADSVTVELTHERPDRGVQRYSRRIPPYALQATVPFAVPIDEGTVGDNRLRVALDPEDAYEEEDAFNNTAERNQVVFSTGLFVVSPPDFGLLDDTAPALRVAVAAPEAVPVLFQLDSLPSFDSPALREHRAPAQLAATWEPGTLEDGRTYYWRARVDDPDEPENWKQAAFTIRTDLRKRGWIQQGRLFQANEQNAFLERTEADWRFQDFLVDVTANSERVTASATLGQIVVNGQLYERRGLGFGMVVLDGGTGAVKANGSFPTYPNQFTPPAEAYAGLQALAAQVRPGDYFIVRTRNIGGATGQPMADSVKAIFREMGSAAIDTLSYRHLWVAVGRKGFPEETQEWVEPPGSGVDILTRSASLAFSFAEGTTTSPVFGPAYTWETLGWDYELANESSTVRIEVLSPGDGTVLLETPATPSGEVDLSGLDARERPFLQLRATLADSSQRSTPQLLQWHVGYRSVAELALDPAAFQFSADTLQVGEVLDVSVAVRNLSDFPADTAVVDYYLTNAQNETARVNADTLFNVAETVSTGYALPTDGLAGGQRLQVEVRQPGLQEQVTFNNVLAAAFFVQTDRVPPRFDVLIDGEMFPNDPNPVTNLQDPALPFVSLRPTVEISVSDDNPYDPLEGDTTAVTLTLDGRPVPSSELEVIDTGGEGENEVRLRYEPDLSGRDTTHTLVVMVQDAAGNPAEDSPYQVHFRVQTDVQVESLYPYPNPMSNFTVFAFRLRGADAALVEDCRIRIYTITGRLVREFDLVDDPAYLDLGGLRIGWNKLRWDGRDDDGDLLATGVYLYKVFLRSEGRELEVNNSSGVEKLVILR